MEMTNVWRGFQIATYICIYIHIYIHMVSLWGQEEAKGNGSRDTVRYWSLNYHSIAKSKTLSGIVYHHDRCSIHRWCRRWRCGVGWQRWWRRCWRWPSGRIRDRVCRKVLRKPCATPCCRSTPAAVCYPRTVCRPSAWRPLPRHLARVRRFAWIWRVCRRA